jgi:IS30 family transposase
MRKYKQLTQEQRYHIYALHKIGQTQEVIASEIGAHKSTISRELSRNQSLRGYRPQQAHELAMVRSHGSTKAIKMTKPLQHLIEEKLSLYQWSPEQISGWLSLQGKVSISHERIYLHVLEDKQQGDTLYQHLRQSHKKQKKRYGKTDTRGVIPNRRFIDDRPKSVDTKKRYGDWEADTIIGKNHKGAIVTLVERKSQFVLMKRLASKTADLTSNAVEHLLKPIKHLCHTITQDNGKEFAAHERIASSLDASLYFAHPYRSWERGLNEQVNGLIRQYLPKKTDFSTVSDEDVLMIMDKLNNRPRKLLGYRTPIEVL